MAPNAGAIFAVLEPFAQRAEDPAKSAAAITGELFRRLAAIQEAVILVIAPPPVQGIGNAGGFRMMVEDRAGRGPQALQAAVDAMVGRARQTPGLVQVFTLFETATPQIYLDIDRTKAQMLGVAAPDVFAALQIYIGSSYVNDFNLFGRTFRVTAQADGPYRIEARDVLNIRVRNSSGGTVPLASFTTVRDVAGPYRVPRYNLYPAAELDGAAATGYSQGQAIEIMAKLAAETLPDGFSYEWTTLAFQQLRAGNVAMFAFTLAVIFLLTTAGGWDVIRAGVLAGANAPDAERYFNLMGGGLSGALGYIALLTPSFIVSPGLLQKLFGARDESAVRRGVGLNALGLLAFAIIPVLMGVIARSQFPDLENREMALPALLTGALPAWLGGLLLGALFSAELSAADAVLFMLTTSLGKDLYKTFIRPDADDKSLLRVSRLTAVGCGAIGAGLAIWFNSVISALRIFYTLLAAALLLPLMFGLYSRRVTARAAIAATLVSVAVTFTLELLTKGQGYAGLPSLIWGTLAGLVATVLLIATPKLTRRDSIHNH